MALLKVLKNSANCAGTKNYSVSDQVKNHPVLFLNYDCRAYLDSSAQNPMGWIVIIDQYGTTQSSYDFHQMLNKQLSAEGNLFDPVLTQVYGNFHCKNNQSKTVLGYFDLNSYRQYRYYLYFTDPQPTGSITVRELTRYPTIPGEGQTTYYPPKWWE